MQTIGDEVLGAPEAGVTGHLQAERIVLGGDGAGGLVELGEAALEPARESAGRNRGSPTSRERSPSPESPPARPREGR